MRGEKPELEQLEKGLQESKPLDDLIKRLADENGAKDLYYKGVYYTQWTGHMMAVAGIYFLAAKEKVGHGDFKKLFIGKDKPVNYMHAWQCMKAAHVVAEHQVFGELRTSRAFIKLLLLPGPERNAIAEEMKGIPGDQVAELLPGKIQKRYDELKDMKARPKKPLTPEQQAKLDAINERYQKDKLDKPWMEINSLWAKAVGALGLLADAAEKMEIEERHYNEIFKRDMIAPLMAPLDRLIHKWRPIEEIQKRATVMERPSFARSTGSGHAARR